MNKVYLIGKILNLRYRLIDRGPVFALAIIDLEIKNEQSVKLVLKDELADCAFSQWKKGTQIAIEGRIRSENNKIYIIAKYCEELK